jgi:Protein of unknown function (DUF2924)
MAALSTRNGAESVELAIERLAALDGEALRIEWRNLFGKRAPKTLPKSLLVRALAYRLQALEFGDLDPHTLRVLEAYAAKAAGGWSGRVRVDRLHRTKQASSFPGVKPGSVLVREWAGELHRVMALDVGFAWNGATYRSLSEVARAITGTRWSGPRFFGLSRGTEAENVASVSTTVIKQGVGPRTRRKAGPSEGPQARPATRLASAEVSP